MSLKQPSAMSVAVPVRREKDRSEKSDSELMTGLSRQEPASLAAVYDRYSAAAYSVLFRITRNRASADDLLQELFLRVWDRARYFDSAKGSLVIWIISLARNLAIDHLRSPQTCLAARSASISQWDLLCYGSASTPLSGIENAVSVRVALADLSPIQKRVLELAYFEGCSQTEIALRLDAPLGTVKSWTRSALNHLRLLMAAPSSATKKVAKNRKQPVVLPVSWLELVGELR